MIVTGAFLANHVENVDGLMNATGAVWDTAMIDHLGADLNLNLVGLVQAGPDDFGKTFHASTEILSPDGTTLIGPIEGEVEAGRSENSALTLGLQIQPKSLGRHVILLRVGETVTSLPFHVIA